MLYLMMQGIQSPQQITPIFSVKFSSKVYTRVGQMMCTKKSHRVQPMTAQYKCQMTLPWMRNMMS